MIKIPEKKRKMILLLKLPQNLEITRQMINYNSLSYDQLQVHRQA